MNPLKDIIRRCLFEAAKPKPKVRDLEGTKLDTGGRGKRAQVTGVKTEVVVATGDCFRFAVSYPMEHSKGMFDNGVVVHGTCTNPDPEPGERDKFEHAWIEYQGKVYDWQTIKLYGMQPHTIRAFYTYWEPSNLKKYTPGKALGNSIAKGHYGPW